MGSCHCGGIVAEEVLGAETTVLEWEAHGIIAVDKLCGLEILGTCTMSIIINTFPKRNAEI